jgi:hypothetical protein
MGIIRILKMAVLTPLTQKRWSGGRLTLRHLALVSAGLGLLLVIFASLYTTYAAFFPIRAVLGYDEAEHLHVAFLLGQGQRPFVDFIENHPTLFNHFLWWLRQICGVSTTRDWATIVRVVLGLHFMLAVCVLFRWLSVVLVERPRGIEWPGLCLCAFAMVGFHRSALPGLWPVGDCLWQIRPDWICHAYTFAGCYLFFRTVAPLAQGLASKRHYASFLLGAFLIGLGNAIVPKGMVLVGAFAVTGLLTVALAPQHALCRVRWQHYVRPVVVFSLLTCAVFVGFAGLDVWLSNIHLKEWYAGVFTINAKKHMLLTDLETNPVTSLIHIFSLGFLPLVALTGWVLWEVLQWKQWSDPRPYMVLLCASITIIVNLLIAPYTNGVTWPHYFIPSFLAAMAIFTVLLVRIVHGMRVLRWPDMLRTQRWAFRGIILIVACHLLLRPFWAGIITLARDIQATDAAMACASDYFPDGCMPQHLIYWTPVPYSIPVMARHFGYHFMLVPDTRFWRDMRALGFGPPLKHALAAAFYANPPDAVALAGPADVVEFM